MSDQPEHVVVPYERFVECQERRRRVAAVLTPPPPTTDADLPPAPREPRLPEATAWRQP